MKFPYPTTEHNGQRVPYPQSFSEKATATLGRFLADGSCRFDERNLLPNLRRTIVRHDVDHDIDWAYRMAEWEAELGIRSTYFILHTTDYFAVESRECFPICHAITELGHEIGIHNDALSAAQGDKVWAARLLEVALIDMRERGGINVVGAADHGGAFPNGELWDLVDPTDFGLQYEAYQVQRSENVNYISDNRGQLRAPLEHVEGRRTVVLVHPEHWAIP